MVQEVILPFDKVINKKVYGKKGDKAKVIREIEPNFYIVELKGERFSLKV